LEATAKGTRILQEGRQRRVESLAHALSSLPEADRLRVAELTELLDQVLRKL